LEVISESVPWERSLGHRCGFGSHQHMNSCKRQTEQNKTKPIQTSVCKKKKKKRGLRTFGLGHQKAQEFILQLQA
jgi:hypothetical protein